MKFSIPISSLLHHKSPALWSIPPEATVFEAIKLMAEKNIGALLVLSDGKLVGLFTERDYARKIALQGKSSRETRVREIFTGVVITVKPQDSVEDCMKLMTEHRVRHLPVVRQGNRYRHCLDWRPRELDDFGPGRADCADGTIHRRRRGDVSAELTS